jgi:hypothetical protein
MNAKAMDLANKLGMDIKGSTTINELMGKLHKGGTRRRRRKRRQSRKNRVNKKYVWPF